MDLLEIARRVRFEASNIIRFRTRDSRDILFLLLQDKNEQNTAIRKISEVQVENFFKTEGHQLTSKSFEEPLADMLQRIRQFRTSYYHRKNLIDERQNASKEINIQQQKDEITDINSISMITPVQMIDGQFETRLGFRTFDWLLSEQIISLEITQEKLQEDIDE